VSAPLKISAKGVIVLALGLSIASAHALEALAKPPAATSKTSLSKEKGAARSVLSIGKDSSEKEVVEAFLSAVTRTDKDNSAKANFEEVANLMAVDEMAKRAFGEAGWPKFSPVEQKEVTSLFRRLIEIRFYPRWRRGWAEDCLIFSPHQNTARVPVGKYGCEGQRYAGAHICAIEAWTGEERRSRTYCAFEEANPGSTERREL